MVFEAAMKRSWEGSYDDYPPGPSYESYGGPRFAQDDEYDYRSDNISQMRPRRGRAERPVYDARNSASDRGRPGGMKYVNPEYYDCQYGDRFEGTKSGAIGPYDDSSVKKRKVDNLSLCVDFVRGFCTKGSMCPKPHVNYVESIDEREVIAKVKFCHNFQNRGACLRPQGCNFLHVTRREEDEFLLTGAIPQTVFDRTAEQGGFHGGDDRPSRGGGGGGGFRGGRGRGDRGFSGRSDRGFSGRSDRGFSGRGDRGGRSGRRSSSGEFVGHSSSKPVTFSSYCVDFLKGTCAKGSVCPLKHVECVENADDREGIVSTVFCHDFLNQKCRRPACKYVHATREEEDYFLANGFFAPTINARNREKLFYSDVCLDFLRNQCIRGNKCNYKHVSQVDNLKERQVLSRSIFCHDFQDGACTRPSCKLLHTSIQDELFFLNNGCLPEHLSVSESAVSARDPKLDMLAKNVCRDFIKNRCEFGDRCRFYHPTAIEIQALVANSNASTRQPPMERSGSEFNNPGGPSQASTSTAPVSTPAPSQETDALQDRVKQLERLLADACYCMTLAVGNDHPAISTLMGTISELAPPSSLANQGQEQAPKETDVLPASTN